MAERSYATSAVATAGVTEIVIACVAIVALALLALARVRAGLHGGDGPYHAFLVADYARALGEGSWPRWSARLNGGLGGPVFVFYGPLPHLVPALLVLLLDVTPERALVADAGVALVVLGAGSLLLARRVAGGARPLAQHLLASHLLALVAPALAILSPFTLFLLVGGLVGQLWGLAFAPWLLLAVDRAVGPGSPRPATRMRVVAAALAVVAMFLAHVATLALSLPLVAGFLATRRRLDRASLGRLGGALVLAAGLAAFQWLPMLLCAPSVHLDWQAEEHPYAEGFLLGGSATTAMTPRARAFAGGALAIGVPSVVQAAFALALVLLLRARRERSDAVAAGAALVLVATFFHSALSAPLWRWIPGLAALQFPWRFEVYATVGMSLLGAAVVTTRGPSAGPPPGRAATVLFVLVVPVVAACSVVFALAARAAPRSAPASNGALPPLTPEERAARAEDLGAYSGNWTSVRPRASTDRRLFPIGYFADATVAAGDATVDVAIQEEQHRALVIRARGPARLRLNLYAFPAWQYALDGRPLSLVGADELPVFDVPDGTHRLEAAYAGEPGGAAGRAVSLFSLLACLWMARRGPRNERHVPGVGEQVAHARRDDRRLGTPG